MEEVHLERKGRLLLKTVPWMNKLELQTVYTKIYSEDAVDQRWAVDRISAWAARGYPIVPVGVECTEALVRAQIQDYAVQHNISVSNFADVSLMYSIALIRFVTLLCEQWQHPEYNLPLRDIARKHGIPDWIIQLRHQATHSTLPPLDKLRSAAATCLAWLDEQFWKLELESSQDYCPAVDDTDEVACREALSDFQSSQCQSLFGTSKADWKKETKLAIRCITSLARQNGKCLVSTLAKPEFLLSLTACSKPLLDSSDSFIQQEAVTLPRNIEKFWLPVISVIHQKDLLGELVLCLLKSVKNLGDENQRMAMAWVWKIVEASSESWGSSTSKDSDIAKVLKHNTPIFNWFELMDACLRSCSKYIPAVLPILIEHVFPPIPTNKKNCLMGLVAIAIGALADVHTDNDAPKEDQRVYTIDNIKTVLELQDVVDRGETSLYYSENPWKLSTDDINWSDYPLGYVFGSENGVLGPKALEIGEISQVKNEDKHGTPNEAAVVNMENNVSQAINESTDMSVDQERIEQDLAVDDDESYASGCNAAYCDPEDIFVF